MEDFTSHTNGASNRLPASMAFLFVAIGIYGLFGTPTPDDPGLIEGLIGALLVLAIGSGGVEGALKLTMGRNFFLKSLQVMFLCGLILPTLSGVYFGNDRMLILRDVAAFAFLGLPLFLSERFYDQERFAGILCLMLVFAGFCFALRTLMPVFNVWVPAGELLYLSNSPLTLFAGVFLAGRLWKNIQTFNRASLLRIAVCAVMLAVILAAMLLDVQRATIGSVFATLILLALFDLVKTPKRTILPLLIVLAAVALLYPLIDQTLQAMATKTAQVGLNARLAEAQAVIDTLRRDPVTLFVGQGWGSTFSSPAVAGIEVNYTHSLLTTMLLKGGVILLLLTVFMVLGALHQIYLIFQQDSVKGLSLFWPLAIPVLLYASHKSLDFGLLLLMIGVWSVGLQTWTTDHSSDKKKEHLKV